MEMNLRTLLKISRPRFWLYLAGPFLVAYALGASQHAQFFSLHFWVYFLYFLIPANIFLYGINDLSDTDTDQFNVRKNSYEHTLQSSQQQPLKRVLVVCVAITVLVALFTADVIAALLLLLLMGLSFAYSAPPLRWKARPFIDSASNVLYAVPGIFAYYVLTGALLSVGAVLTIACWTAAMHLFSAIPDIDADARSGLRTSAVVLGERRSVIVCSMLWLSCMVGAFLLTASPLSFLLAMYVLIPLWSFVPGWSIARLYPMFPYLNAGLGGVLFWIIIVQRFL